MTLTMETVLTYPEDAFTRVPVSVTYKNERTGETMAVPIQQTEDGGYVSDIPSAEWVYVSTQMLVTPRGRASGLAAGVDMASNEWTKAYSLMPAVDEFGCAHIVVSDGNVDDGSIEFCVEECTNPPAWRLEDPLGENDDERAVALNWLRAMRKLTEKERWEIWLLRR
jgi:hypothetical protein